MGIRYWFMLFVFTNVLVLICDRLCPEWVKTTAAFLWLFFWFSVIISQVFNIQVFGVQQHLSLININNSLSIIEFVIAVFLIITIGGALTTVHEDIALGVTMCLFAILAASIIKPGPLLVVYGEPVMMTEIFSKGGTIVPQRSIESGLINIRLPAVDAAIASAGVSLLWGIIAITMVLSEPVNGNTMLWITASIIGSIVTFGVLISEMGAWIIMLIGVVLVAVIPVQVTFKLTREITS